MTAKLYAGTSTSGTLLASVERVELEVDSRAEDFVFHGAATPWPTTGPIIETPMLIVCAGRVDADAQMNLLRPRVLTGPEAYYLRYRDGAAWQGNFRVRNLREEMPGGSEPRFTIRLTSSGPITYYSVSP
jgi:hypothetical protein